MRYVTLRRAHEVRIRRLANQALVDVFNSLGGIRWSNRSGWLTPGTDVKTWHGLTVDAGKLVSLNLISNDLEVCIGCIRSQVTCFVDFQMVPELQVTLSVLA